MPLDTLDHWYAIKRTTESVLGKRTVLLAARKSETELLRQALEGKEREVKALKDVIGSYDTELSTCQRDRDNSERSLRVARSWNRILLPAAGVLIGLIILR